MCKLCDDYGKFGDIHLTLMTHISVALLPEMGNVRSHRHGGRKSPLWVNYNDVVMAVHEYEKEHGVNGRIDPRAQRTQGTLGERIAAGDPEARAQVDETVVSAMLSGTPDEVAMKVRHFDATYTEPAKVVDLTTPRRRSTDLPLNGR